MAFSEELADRIRRYLARRKTIVEKRIFGGIGFLLNGNMLVGIWKDSLIVRLEPQDGSDALKQPHVHEFDITGMPMKGWILVAGDGLRGDEQLQGWIQKALQFVLKLPVK